MLDYQHNINISFLRGSNSVWTHAHVLFAVYWLNVSTYFLLINCNQNHFKNQAWNSITSETRTESEPVIKSKPFLVKKVFQAALWVVCISGLHHNDCSTLTEVFYTEKTGSKHLHDDA